MFRCQHLIKLTVGGGWAKLSNVVDRQEPTSELVEFVEEQEQWHWQRKKGAAALWTELNCPQEEISLVT